MGGDRRTTEPPWTDRATISHEGGLLRIRYAITPEAAERYQGLAEFYGTRTQVLVPRAEDLFFTGEAFEGELVQLAPWEIWEFTRADGVATGLEVRGARDDELQMTATRIR